MSDDGHNCFLHLTHLSIFPTFKKSSKMRKFIPLLIFIFLSTFLTAQTRIDGSFAFQTDPAKKYSLYIPSGYDDEIPHRLMLGFHPFNPTNWDAQRWCDSLMLFAETNNLILACPDGGADGQVDDPIDVDFTTALLDSMSVWYNINEDKVYAMGFSVGGRATYTYSMNYPDRIKGCIPIGAAVTDTMEVEGILPNAAGKPYYILHGSLDAPDVRYTPIRTALILNGAIVDGFLMSGVGHTFSFPNRLAILTDAFTWIDTVNCPVTTSIHDNFAKNDPQFSLYPNPVQQGQNIYLKSDEPSEGNYRVRVYNSIGSLIYEENDFQISNGNNRLPAGLRMEKGLNVIEISSDQQRIKSIPFLVF